VNLDRKQLVYRDSRCGSTSRRPGRFYALGNLGQYIYVASDAGAVIVRNGSDWGVDDDSWVAVMRDLADRRVEGS
jgi:hypothetical protein